MSAVTFLGPRDIRVTRKPIPKLASPTVREGAESVCTEQGAQGLHMKTITSCIVRRGTDSSCAMLCRTSLSAQPWPGS